MGTAVIATALSGCGSDSPPAARAPADLMRCDITDTNCQSAIFSSVAELVGADGSSVPPIRTISVEEFAEDVRSGVTDDDLSGEDAVSRALRLIGFIPEAAQSAVETEIDYQVSAIAAYYSSNSKSITIIDRDYAEFTAQTILAHEFVHAIQDRQFGIRPAFALTEGTTDGVMGARSVVEGDATYISYAWAYEQLGEIPDWDSIYESFQEGTLSAAADSEFAIGASASNFPYSFGIEFLGRAIEGEGLPVRGELFGNPPRSALDAFAGYPSVADSGAPPLDLPATSFGSPIPGSFLALEDRSGPWYVFSFLRRLGIDEPLARELALRWRGDRLGAFDAGSEVVAVWRVRFEGDPSFFADAVNGSFRDVAWSAVVEGNDVYVIAAETNEALALWEAQPRDVVAAALASVGDIRKSARSGPPERCSPPPLP